MAGDTRSKVMSPSNMRDSRNISGGAVDGMAGTRPFKDEADVCGASDRVFERYPDLAADRAAVGRALEALLTV